MQVRMYHTNDIHGNLDFLRRVQAWLAVPDDEARFDKWFIRDMVQHSLMDGELFRTATIPRERGNEYGI